METDATKPAKPVDPNRTKYIWGGVVAAAFLIGIIVAVVVLTRPTHVVIPTPTATPTHHFPVIIDPIAVTQDFKIVPQLGGVTPSSCVLYLSGSIVGIVLSADNVIDDFITVNTTSGVQTISKNFPVSIGYSAYAATSGATFDTSSGFVNLFDLKLQDCTVNNRTELSNIPSDKFNSQLYIVSDQNSQVIVASLVLASGLQTYNLYGFQQNGTLLPNFAITNGIPVSSNYPLMLASSQQVFFGLLIFDSTLGMVYDILYTTTTTAVSTFTFTGDFVSAACTQDTSKLILATTNTVYYYTRNIHATVPAFQLQDFLTFQFGIKSCALDAAGLFLSLGTSQKSTIIGKLSTTQITSLKVIEIGTQPVSLGNSNGPCGIQDDATHIFVFQADTSQNAAVFQVGIF